MKKTHTPGQDFEKRIKDICDLYEIQGIARLRKVDPPTRILRPPGRKPITIHLESPYLDFVGTWIEKGGKTIMVECKSTEEPRLAILAEKQKGSGIKHSQLENAFAWEKAGAAVGFLWHHNGQVRMVTPSMVAAHATARKSIPWLEAHRVPPGDGFIFHDFLALLRVLHR
jgi:hypothetical protein